MDRRPSDAYPPRHLIERAIEALIDLLDCIDGDPDLEPEHDAGADDLGERDGDCWREAV